MTEVISKTFVCNSLEQEEMTWLAEAMCETNEKKLEWIKSGHLFVGQKSLQQKEQVRQNQPSLYFSQKDESQAGLSWQISHGSVRTLQLLAKPFSSLTPAVHPSKLSNCELHGLFRLMFSPDKYLWNAYFWTS